MSEGKETNDALTKQSPTRCALVCQKKLLRSMHFVTSLRNQSNPH